MLRLDLRRFLFLFAFICVASLCGNILYIRWYRHSMDHGSVQLSFDHISSRNNAHAEVSDPHQDVISWKPRHDDPKERSNVHSGPGETHANLSAAKSSRLTSATGENTGLATADSGCLPSDESDDEAGNVTCHSDTAAMTAGGNRTGDDSAKGKRLQHEILSLGRGLVSFNASKACPENSTLLLGSLSGWHDDISKEELIKLYPEMEKGGRLRPKGCEPRQRLAVIFPYRNRYSHLHVLLNNLIPFLTRQQADVTFFVVEQNPPSTFNRGALLNIGFLEAEKLARFDCYIFHDVDLIPLNDNNLYRCGPNPRHYAVAMNKYNYTLLYKDYCGGVVGMTRDQYLTINGNSNLYVGWGGEDDDIILRIRNRNLTLARYALNISKYDMIKHKRDQGNDVNPLRRIILKSATKRQAIEGLNTVKYELNNITFDHLYTWITISLNTTDILRTVPMVTIQDVEEARKVTKTAMKERFTKRRKVKHRAENKTVVSKVVAAPPSEVTEESEEVTDSPKEVTQELKEVTPAPREVTPAPKEVTPAPKEVTQAPKEVTPAPKKVTPAPKEVTQAPKEVTPAPKEVTPAPKEVTPAPKEVTPAPKEMATARPQQNLTTATDKPRSPATSVKLKR